MMDSIPASDRPDIPEPMMRRRLPFRQEFEAWPLSWHMDGWIEGVTTWLLYSPQSPAILTGDMSTQPAF